MYFILSTKYHMYILSKSPLSFSHISTKKSSHFYVFFHIHAAWFYAENSHFYLFGILLEFYLLYNLARCLINGVFIYKSSDIGKRINAAVSADDRTGIQNAVTADLGKISDNRTKLAQLGIHLPSAKFTSTLLLSFLTLDVIAPAPRWERKPKILSPT